MLTGFGVHATESAILPSTARYHADCDTGSLRRSIGEANTVRLCGGAAAVLIMIAAGPFLLGLFGQSFRSGYPRLVLLLIAQMIGVLAGPTAQLLSVSGRSATV
jgi:O-antigen/teichoic acid export membrane protein